MRPGWGFGYGARSAEWGIRSAQIGDSQRDAAAPAAGTATLQRNTDGQGRTRTDTDGYRGIPANSGDYPRLAARDGGQRSARPTTKWAGRPVLNPEYLAGCCRLKAAVRHGVRAPPFLEFAAEKLEETLDGGRRRVLYGVRRVRVSAGLIEKHWHIPQRRGGAPPNFHLLIIRFSNYQIIKLGAEYESPEPGSSGFGVWRELAE